MYEQTRANRLERVSYPKSQNEARIEEIFKKLQKKRENSQVLKK